MSFEAEPEIPEFVISERLAAELYAVLGSCDLKSDAFEAEFARLKARHHQGVYAELIHLLTHLRFAPEVAADLWERVGAHRRTMEARLAASVDPRVALISYLVDVTPLLDNPKIVEMTVFHETRDRAYRDGLTGLRNYRFFAECLEQKIAASEQDDTPVSLTLIDLDDFKAFNDRHGHEAGNRALVTVAHALSASVRPSDLLARFGGEEFAVVLPGTPKQGAMLVADKLRRAVEGCTVRMEDGGICSGLTISVGVATAPADAHTTEDFIKRADAAMYEAKTAGKNALRAYANSLRSFPRQSASLHGTFAVGVDRRRPMTTVNVSPRGVLIRVDDDIPNGTLIDAQIDLPNFSGGVQFLGRVVCSRGEVSGGYEVAIRIVEIPGAERKALKDYLNACAASAA